jgi:hypothetical protein
MRSPAATIAGSPELVRALAVARTERGQSLLELADGGTILLIFLRHFGCSYCRQAISDISEIKTELAAKHIRPVFVHLGTPERARPYFDYYQLADVDRISDPTAALYQDAAFSLPRTHPLSHFLLPKVWYGWLSGGIRKYGVSLLLREDSFQMPGVFVVRNRTIVNSFHFKTIADQPDYLALVS